MAPPDRRGIGRDPRDAFGHALLDYLRGRGRGYEVIERDDGHVNVLGGREVYLADYPRWPERHRKAMTYAKGRILDVGCGAGRHALYLQGRGLHVLGIDASPLAIAVCKKRGLKNAKVMSITRIGPALGVFDTVLMLGNNFGLFANPRRAQWLLRRLYAITAPSATVIVESRDPYQIDNPFHLGYHRRNRRNGRMPGRCESESATTSTRRPGSTTCWFQE